MGKREFFKRFSDYYATLGIFALLIAIILILIPTAPYVVYKLRPSETKNEATKIATPLVEDGSINVEKNTKVWPAQDLSLPKAPFITMDKIEVFSPISTDSDYITALKNGAWLVPEYGTPMNEKKPIIIAAHRFGYLYWDDATRKQISFYNLPKMKVGDTIDIIWDQRVFKYEIFKEEEKTYITDYSADLILYTCKYFDSPIRIFRYARLINVE